MDGIEFKLTGLAEIQEKLERLPIKAARRIVRQGAASAAFIWQREMEQTVRQGWHHWSRNEKRRARWKGINLDRVFGFIASHIRTRVTVKSDLSSVATVGPSRAGYWAGFLEFGSRGRSFPFIRRAFEDRKKDVVDEFVIEAKAALAAEGLKTS